MNHAPTANAVPSPLDRTPGERGRPGLTPSPRADSIRRAVIHALATRPSLTGIFVLEYGLRYAAEAIRIGGRRTLFFAAAGLLSFCVAVGVPGAEQTEPAQGQRVYAAWA